MTDKTELKAAKVPQSRLARLSGMGSLAGRIAGNVLLESGKQLAKGQKPQLSNVLLTEANARQVADKLANMRGAAMKVGQLLSMDAGNLMPQELAVILERLRSEAMIMPANQLFDVLERNWGEEWQEQFSRFSFEPVAAASIGQVHKALTPDGRQMAVKIQYPGIKESIDSDINNVVSLLRLSGLLPSSLEIEPLLDEARTQLRLEADYLHEGAQIRIYQQLIDGFHLREHLCLPEFYDDLSTTEILCMSYMPGESLEKVMTRHRGIADHIMTLLMDLFFAELAEFHCVQTDPNLANYQYDTHSKQLILLDFGAVRHFSPEFVANYLNAMRAASTEDRAALRNALQVLGFFQNDITAANVEVVLDIFSMATEPLRHEGDYDFANANLAQRIRDLGASISSDPDAWHTPPPDILFLHRKMGGLYLIATRLQARLDV
ncbi:MAG: AarF/ABC1/UbiB kinase family protein, partial [Oceanospirillaceae bacterium]|nr:AarF/ABC1/UbiB kinase family protein [Oceanospirillaceae bacterium]